MQSIKKETIQRVLSRAGNKCSICGAKNIPLIISHLVPVSKGGSNDDYNLIVLCEECLKRKDKGGYNEVEFTNYLQKLMELNPAFKNTKCEVIISDSPRYIADITTNKITDKNDLKSFLIECKNVSTLSGDVLLSAIDQITNYKKKKKFDYYVIAFPGRISQQTRKFLKAANIIVWDADSIAHTFKSEIKKVTHSHFQEIFIALSPLDFENRLIEKLKTCKPGKEYWPEYQKLVGQIIEHLFCPPLESPLPESRDQFNINRRDWIFPNYSDNGFWRFMREMYKADYIVVDAKNYKNKITKNQVLQIANYLKQHGSGLFAIIATRKGADKGAEITLREQWIIHNKLIIVLEDANFENMLLASSVGNKAYQELSQLIEKFRLSI